MGARREDSTKRAGGNLGIRLQMMQPLPSQVLRAFKSARRGAENAPTLEAIQEARRALDIYEAAMREWSDSLEAMMHARGADDVDKFDYAQCDSFVARIDRKALQKQYVRRVAIAAGRLELERLLGAYVERAEP